jgi:hypothetical protein
LRPERTLEWDVRGPSAAPPGRIPKEADFVRAFFRRWLAELLFKERKDLFWQLPPGYRYGEPVWPKFLKPAAAPVKVLPEPPKVELTEIIRPMPKTVRQSLPFVHGAELLSV